MGMYLNIGNAGFASVRKGLYVDKSELIAFVNGTLGTKDKLTCVSRPRRFGKSMAASMLAAYYGPGNDNRQFDHLAIAKDASYREHLHQYIVIFLNIQQFLSRTHDISQMNALIESYSKLDVARYAVASLTHS